MKQYTVKTQTVLMLDYELDAHAPSWLSFCLCALKSDGKMNCLLEQRDIIEVYCHHLIFQGKDCMQVVRFAFML
jgi:hypothetical protein